MKQAILMSDVVGSMQSNHVDVRNTLAAITAEANERWADQLLSPLTVTLGDEFQSIARSYEEAMRICFWVDEASRRSKAPLNLRFSIVYGEVSTPLNKKIAYGMIGEGLQLARQLISTKTREKIKYQARTGNERTDCVVNKVLFVAASITERWKRKDYELIDSMIRESNDEVVGEQFQKQRQQIYKRRNTLMVSEYQAMKCVALSIAREVG